MQFESPYRNKGVPYFPSFSRHRPSLSRLEEIVKQNIMYFPFFDLV
jgi:hypothetical protein